MRSVFVHGELADEDIQSLFASVGTETRSQASYAFGPVRVILITGSKYFFRTSDHVGLVVLACSNGSAQRIDISAVGGGTAGIFTGVESASESLESETYDAVARIIASKGLGSSASQSDAST